MRVTTTGGQDVRAETTQPRITLPGVLPVDTVTAVVTPYDRLARRGGSAGITAAGVSSGPAAVARRCASRRRFAIRLPRARRGTRITSASVRVNGRRVAVSAGARRRATVDLRLLPRGTFAVQVRVVLSDGSVLAQTRRYRTCVPRRP